MGGMTGLLLLLWVGATVSTAVNLQKRIIGGHECEDTERLYHVELEAPNGDSCGGSLISKRWILTAAHCLKRDLTAYLGVHPTEQNPQEIQITDPPEIFNNQDGDHDIMLLKLPQDSAITPVKLPDCEPQKRPQIGTLVQIAGYGATRPGLDDERVPGVAFYLQCANINIVDCTGLINTLERDGPNYYQNKKHQHWRCYQTPGVDACRGDSGGGVIYNGMIYGVHSFSGSPTHACVEPAAFMDICNPEYNQWILDTIAK